MTPMFSKNPNLSMVPARHVPDRATKALAWTAMVVVCAAAHFEFMRLISPLAASIGF